MKITKAKKFIHEHFLNIVNTEITQFTEKQVVRILEVGCGNGELIAYLFENLPYLNNKVSFEIYGFDVSDHCIDTNITFPDDVIEKMENKFPNIPWKNRIYAITSNDKWPYQNNFFDLILSNYVLEHVDDHNFLFQEMNRTLSNEGKAIHVFPLKHYVYEAHLHIPFVHRITNLKLLKYYILLWSYLNVGEYKSARENGIDRISYANNSAKYLQRYTNYLTNTELLKLAKDNDLKINFEYTVEMYSEKIKQKLGLQRKYQYDSKRLPIVNYLWFLALRYVEGITVCFKK